MATIELTKLECDIVIIEQTLRAKIRIDSAIAKLPVDIVGTRIWRKRTKVMRGSMFVKLRNYL